MTNKELQIIEKGNGFAPHIQNIIDKLYFLTPLKLLQVFECKKITVPKALGIGGNYYWLVVGNEDENIYFIGLALNCEFISCSISNNNKIVGTHYSTFKDISQTYIEEFLEQ